MQSSIEKLSSLQRKLIVTISAQEVNDAYQEELKKVAQTVQLKGFRPGKVPFAVVEQRFGSSILYEIAGKLINNSFEQAITENQLKLAGNPKIEPKPIEKDKPFEFEALFEVLPEVEIKDVTGVTVEKPQAEITETDIQKALKDTQKHYVEWKAVERSAKDGDRLSIDFEGFIDGKAMPGGAAKDFQLELGSNSMIPGFEAGLLGAQVGKPVELDVTFPADYHHKEIAGKAAHFKVVVKKVEEPHLPELNDELAKKMGVQEGVEKLKATIAEDLNKELQHCLQTISKNNVLEKLIEVHSIELPKALVDAEIDRLKEYAKSQVAAKTGSKELNQDLPNELFTPQAEKRVALGLLLGEIIKKYDIKVDSQKIKEKINQIASMYKDPEQIIAWYQSNKGMLAEVEASVLEEQVVAQLLQQMKVVEKKISYQEALEKVS